MPAQPKNMLLKNTSSQPGVGAFSPETSTTFGVDEAKQDGMCHFVGKPRLGPVFIIILVFQVLTLTFQVSDLTWLFQVS